MRSYTAGLFASISFALVISQTSAALEVPLSAAVDTGEKESGLSLFVGISGGNDSNINRADSDNAADDSVTEALVGLSYKAGNQRNRFGLLGQFRNGMHASLSEYDFTETRVGLFAGGGADKVHLLLRGDYAMLAEPVDLDVVDVLERTKLFVLPALEMKLGAVNMSVGYSVTTLEYLDDVAENLSNTDAAIRCDLGFGKQTGGSFFVHVDSGAVDFADNTVANARSDFDYQKAYVGWRGEKENDYRLEIGVGQFSATNFSEDSSLSEEGTYSLIRFRKLLNGGRSGVELAFVQDAEAAATAELKKINRASITYSQTSNRRWGWHLTIKSETDEYVEPDSATQSDSLSLLAFDIGFQLAIGSPNKMHGRLYATINQESRTGDESTFDYERLKYLVGLALVY